MGQGGNLGRKKLRDLFTRGLMRRLSFSRPLWEQSSQLFLLFPVDPLTFGKLARKRQIG
jgi:hypothetical protein